MYLDNVITGFGWEGFDRAEWLYGVTQTKHEIPPAPKGNITVVIVRASDLRRAVAGQNAKRISSGQVLTQPKFLDVEIERRGRK